MCCVTLVLAAGCGDGVNAPNDGSSGEERQSLAVGAVYSATHRAPTCSGTTELCSSTTTGRAQLGPEASTPNTLNASCVDGASGTFHVDESVDGLRVRSMSGATLVAGGAAQIEVDVWAWAGYSSDKLDVFITTTPAAPVWTLVSTSTPTRAGAQTMTVPLTLPAASSTSYAVRAQLRYGGTAEACAAGGYNDRDDLVFDVGLAAPVDAGVAEGGPSIALTPNEGASIPASRITFTVTATDSDGLSALSITTPGGTTTVTTPRSGVPTSTQWNASSTAPGTYPIFVTARDTLGNTSTFTRTITITPNARPVPTFTQASYSVTSPALVTVTAGATDADGSVASVIIMFSCSGLGTLQWVEDTTAPYQATFNSALVYPPNATGGSSMPCQVSALALDDRGADSDVSSVPLTVRMNSAPFVAFLAPLINGAVVSGVVNFSLAAYDPDNAPLSALRVTLPNGSSLNLSPSSPSSSFDSTLLPEGAASMSATATDVVGNSTTVTVTFTIRNAPPPVTSMVLGDFEAGLTPWTGNINVVREATTATAHQGLGSVTLSPTATIAFLTRRLTVPTTASTVTFWYRVETSDRLTNISELRVIAAGSSVQSAKLVTTNVNSNAGYQFFTLDVRSLAGQFINLSFQATKTNTGNYVARTTYRLDDIVLN
jgi:hypothetical protein